MLSPKREFVASFRSSDSNDDAVKDPRIDTNEIMFHFSSEHLYIWFPFKKLMLRETIKTWMWNKFERGGKIIVV